MAILFGGASKQQAARHVEHRTSAPKADRRQRILVVDDQYEVRDVVRLMLEEAGFDVLHARAGSDALALLDASAGLDASLGRIDLAVVDVNLPGMDGRRLATQINAASPATKILYMSGEPLEDVAAHGVLSDSWFIQKPFTTRELLGRVAQRLAPS
jgi:DNA-binding response OmpR family regulator